VGGVDPADGLDEFNGFNGSEIRGDSMDDGFGFDPADVQGSVLATTSNGSGSNQQEASVPMTGVTVHSSGGGTLQAQNMQVVNHVHHHHTTQILNVHNEASSSSALHRQRDGGDHSAIANGEEAYDNQAGSGIFAINRSPADKMRAIGPDRSNKSTEADALQDPAKGKGAWQNPDVSPAKVKEVHKKNEKGYLESFKEWVYQYVRWYWSIALIAVLITVVSPDKTRLSLHIFFSPWPRSASLRCECASKARLLYPSLRIINPHPPCFHCACFTDLEVAMELLCRRHCHSQRTGRQCTRESRPQRRVLQG
jgi:hypothetical protein